MEPVARIYEKELLESGDTDEAQILRMKTKIQNSLEEDYQKSKSYSFKAEDWVTKEWDDIK
jgi:2-oxoglutarate dehydrogenase complex dehydrogenase (E1) component-like enzyme